jgi:hypothetical protein
VVGIPRRLLEVPAQEKHDAQTHGESYNYRRCCERTGHPREHGKKRALLIKRQQQPNANQASRF